MRAELYPHQVRALGRLRQSLGQGHRRPVVQMPTGAGKTHLAAAVVEGALTKGNRVVFCVPAISLIDQTVRSFWQEGITDVGVIQGNHELTDWSRPVQVASVQTLQRRPYPKADVVVIDECHKRFKFYDRWMSDACWANVPFIGLSATPWTKGLGKSFDDLIIAATTSELIEKGFLSDFRVFAPGHPDLSGVRTLAGDYHEGDLGEAMNQAVLVADVVQTWQQRGEGRPTLCFAVDRAHAKHLQQLFENAGIPAGYVDAYTDRLEREQIRQRFHAGDLKVVCSVGCLTTGVDWDVRCIVLARPTKSEMLFVQIIGRGLRTADGKDMCLILDHSDTHLRLGFVTDIHHEKLDDGEGAKAKAPRDKVRLPKECAKCSYLKPPKVHKCPACGFAPERQADVEQEDGELVEVQRKRQKTIKADRATKQRWFSGLLQIAKDRHYSRGWVSHQYRNKFGVWPQSLTEMPVRPDPEVTSYVTASLIRYAKSKGKGRHDSA